MIESESVLVIQFGSLLVMNQMSHVIPASGIFPRPCGDVIENMFSTGWLMNSVKRR